MIDLVGAKSVVASMQRVKKYQDFIKKLIK